MSKTISFLPAAKDHTWIISFQAGIDWNDGVASNTFGLSTWAISKILFNLFCILGLYRCLRECRIMPWFNCPIRPIQWFWWRIYQCTCTQAGITKQVFEAVRCNVPAQIYSKFSHPLRSHGRNFTYIGKSTVELFIVWYQYVPNMHSSDSWPLQQPNLTSLFFGTI